MANYADLKNAITAVIRTNGNQEITGQLLQDALMAIIENIGDLSGFAGIADPGTVPGSPDSNQFYLIGTPGVYPNFGGLEVEENAIYIVNNRSGDWEAAKLLEVDLSGYASSSIVDELGKTVGDLGNTVGDIDRAFVPGKNLFSLNFVMKGFYNSEGEWADSDNRICTTKIEVKPGTDYAARLFSPQDSGYSRVVFFNGTSIIGTIPVSSSGSITFTSPANCTHAAFTIQNAIGIGLDPLRGDSYAHTFQLEEGSTPTTFEPYKLSLLASNVIGIPPAVESKLMPLNKFFEAGSVAAETDWINRAIVDIEWFGVGEGSFRRFNALGKNYNFGGGNFRTYLGFRADNSSTFIHPADWDQAYVENEPVPTGILTYFLRRTNAANLPENYIGRVTINWDEVPDGVRFFEGDLPSTNPRFTALTYKNIDPATSGYVDSVVTDLGDKIPPLNRFFEVGTVAANTNWLNKAIIDVEFYGVADNDYRETYYIGKNFSTMGTVRHYLSFKQAAISTEIIPTKWDGTFLEGSPAPTGIVTYNLRRRSQLDDPENYIGRITVNWDEMPDGLRITGVNTGDPGVNSRFNESTYAVKINAGDDGVSKDDYIIYDSDTGPYFDSLIEDDFSSGGGANPQGLRFVQDWYDLWDGLMASAPTGYITKRTLGTDIPTTGGLFLPMYAYEFNPPYPILNGSQLPYMPKVLALLAIHGFEKTGAISFYSLMKRMIENWEESPFLEFLRFNIPFVVVPSANPHGWQDYSTSIGSRTNFNGVDLNRNFPIGWSLGGEGTSLYSGPSPASEIETQYMIDLIDEFEGELFIGLDIHNFGELELDGGGWLLTYQTTSNPVVYNVSKAFSLLTSRKLQSKYPAINQMPGFQLSRAQRSGPRGLSRDYLQHKGFYAATFEACRTFPYDSDNTERWDNTLLRIGSENIGNYLRIMIKECALDFNANK